MSGEIRSEIGIADCASTHLSAVTAIYEHHVRCGTGTFETDPPTVEEMDRRRTDVRRRGLPFLVATADDVVIGFAYAAPFRLRPAYRYTVEDSVYVHPAWVGIGIGRLLLSALLRCCATLHLVQVLALVGDSQNAASIRLHESAGFKRVGLLPATGYKLERWLDVVILQKTICEPPATGPTGQGWQNMI